MNPTTYTVFESPIGPLTISSRDDAIVGLDFPTSRGMGPRFGADWVEDADSPALRAATTQLEAYFAGDRTEFDLPLRPAGTEFQLKVWDQLCRIPFGETISYGELAKRIGNTNASRAVGMANGRNPIAIIIPCHRVIGADGSLTGFGGGIDLKRKLLDLERIGATDEYPHPCPLVCPLANALHG